jgi:hypothetical protein
VSPVRYELDFISQKTAFFIVTAVKTSNLTRRFIYLFLPSIIRLIKRRGMRLAGLVARMGLTEMQRMCVGTSKGKRELGRTRRRGLDNTEVGVRKKECGGVSWTDLAQKMGSLRAFENTVMISSSQNFL